jgi:hypothetical protein
MVHNKQQKNRLHLFFIFLFLCVFVSQLTHASFPDALPLCHCFDEIILSLILLKRVVALGATSLLLHSHRLTLRITQVDCT